MSIAISYIEQKTQEHYIDNLQTGNLVKFKADVMPIIYHYGIIERIGDELYIIHNQTSIKNAYGGNLIREDLREYVKGRKIVSVEKTRFDQNQLSEMTEFLKDKKYHFINNNCERFINYLKSREFVSPQTVKWGLITSLALATIILIKRK